MDDEELRVTTIARHFGVTRRAVHKTLAHAIRKLWRQQINPLAYQRGRRKKGERE